MCTTEIYKCKDCSFESVRTKDANLHEMETDFKHTTEKKIVKVN